MLTLAACAVVAVVTALVWPREREPVYKGKRLSEWIKDCPVHSRLVSSARSVVGGSQGLVPVQAETNVHRAGAQAAVRAIGTNGLPLLVDWIGYEQPGWKAMLARAAFLPQAVRRSSFVRWLDGEEAQDRSIDALAGLCLLGAGARPAVPELRALMQGHAGGAASRRAVFALQVIAPEVLETNGVALPWPQLAGPMARQIAPEVLETNGVSRGHGSSQ